MTEHGILNSGNTLGEPRLEHCIAENADDFVPTYDDEMVYGVRTHVTLRALQRLARADRFDLSAHDVSETHTSSDRSLNVFATISNGW